MKMGPREGLVLLLVFLCIGNAFGTVPDGLYITNSTHILFSRGGTKEPTSVFKQDNGRIVGLAVDTHNGLLFWSDIGYFTRGIYKAHVDPADGKLTYVEKIIATDVAEVNGISVDYAARHVYFTDGRHRTLELVTYDGKYRRTLDAPHDVPRGVVADPVNGYLFWNDQGVGKIERSRLDGSERTTIVQGDSVQWPNQMIQYRTSRLLWVDAMSKKLMSSELNGQNLKEEADLSAETGVNAIYGLAVSGNNAYVSVWNSNKVLIVNLLTGSYAVKFINLGSDVLFSMAYASKQEQPMPTQGNACAQDDNGGCQYLCLPITSTMHRCGCPTYGGLVLNDDGTCSAPAEILLYALADQGEVGFVDISSSNHHGDHPKDRYTVGRSMRPVAVAYDPVQKKVYWSDVHERSIHVSNLDGSEHRLFLTSNNSLGIVDGMAVDIKGRRLYFSNMDMVAITGVSYSWHKIEAIGLDGTGRRTVVETAEKPRGLFIDQEKRQLFYTDWGSQAAVVHVELDGSSPKVLLSSALQNPNSVVYDHHTDHVYVVDSFYKSRKPENLGTFGDEQRGKLFKLNGDDVTEIALDLKTPFGLAIYAGHFYISDWDTHSIMRFNMDTQQKSMVMSDVSGPMALHYAEVSMEEVDSGKCDVSNCDDMCFELSNRDTTCTCDSYDAKVLAQDDKTCAVSTNSLLIADLSSLDIRSLHGTDDSTYNLVGGNTFTNIVSLVHDRVNGIVYFSDVNRRNIYKVTITTGRTELFRTTDDIIDGMTLNKARTRLYWTDFFKGTIAYTDVNTSEGDTETNRQLLVRGLDKPRAIVLDEKNNYVYWTEWGERPRVARARLSDGSQVITIVDSELVTRPNGLDLDLNNQKLYVGDAGKDRVAILECPLNDIDEECQALPYTVNVPQHIYSIKKFGSLLYYTDWLAEELALIDMRTGKKLSIVENLMRPTEFWFTVQEDPSCPSGHTCSGTCLPHMTGYTCTCPPGQVLGADDSTCTDTGTGEWMETPDSCATPCKDGSVCARTAGTATYACVCKEGYKMVDGRCMVCDENTYQPFLNRSPMCQSCPSQATSNSGATQCRCPSSLAWNHHTGACTGTKPGECPSVSIKNAVSCSGPQCEEDGDCPGAQRCCADSYCATPRCQDPINLWECVFEGRLYAVGEVFHPDACVRCSCEADKMYASSLYGGATCSITNCPSLDCDESEHFVPGGECCPMCKTPTDQLVHIHNCPEEPHEIDLPNSSDMAKLDKKWSYSDALKRPVEIRQQPPDRYLPWIGNGRTQDVRVEALAPKSNGDWDKDVCELQVIVSDNHSPVVTCPSDIKVMTAEFPAQVRWTPAQYEDNVCGRSDCAISSFPPPGSDFSSGVTTVQYTVQDEAGNKAECSFQVSVYEPESPTCVPPMIYNGYLDCSGGSQQTCAVTCSAGYSVYRTTFVSCKEDTWSPPITEIFQRLACAKKIPRRSTGSVTIKNVQCPSSSLDSLNLSIQEHIENNYIGASNDHVTATVTSHGCGPRKRRQAEDVMLTIEILLEVDADSTMSTPLADLLRHIKDDTNDARLCELWITNMEDDEDCGSVEASITMPSTGCQPGQETHDDYCIECPVGTYETDGKCELCPEGQYQGVEGQAQCHPCPEGLSAPEGSVFESDCVVDTYALPMIPIIIGAVVAGIVLLMIIGAIVFWMFRRKRHGSGELKADPNSYHNSAYDAENIADNPYVNSAKRPYENLVKKDEMDEKN